MVANLSAAPLISILVGSSSAFDEQVLSGVLRTAHLEISGFIARCDQAMLTTEQRILRILVR